MPSSGILVIDRHTGTLEADGMTLRLRRSDGGIVPLGPVEKIIIIGALTLNANVIHRCYEKDIDLLFLTGRQLKFAGRIAGQLHRDARLRISQFQALTPSFQAAFIQKLVRTKILQEKKALVAWEGANVRRAHETLDYCLLRLEEDVLPLESVRGIEGSAHAAYFSAYTDQFGPSWEFNKRTRRPPLDPINALLSLTYTMIHYEVVRELEIAGFDPFLGFYHEIFHGRESLACDLVELFRTAVDLWVLERIKTRDFRKRDFFGTSEKGVFLKKSARVRYFETYHAWSSNQRATVKQAVYDLKRTLYHEEGALPESS